MLAHAAHRAASIARAPTTPTTPNPFALARRRLDPKPKVDRSLSSRLRQKAQETHHEVGGVTQAQPISFGPTACGIHFVATVTRAVPRTDRESPGSVEHSA